jgi:polysaccharide biosynthesis/export protein
MRSLVISRVLLDGWRREHARRYTSYAFVLTTISLAACSSSVPSTSFAPSATEPAGTTLAATGDCDGSPELAALWQQRMTQTGAENQPLGPGDVLSVSVVGIQELQDQRVQVSDSGAITLPFVGKIEAQGKSLDELEQELEVRFADYIKSPEVHVVMQKDRSQTVAVMGLVSKPMLVPLTMPNETIMDVIGEAGGLSNDASQRVLFMPREAQPQTISSGAHGGAQEACDAGADAANDGQPGGPCGADPAGVANKAASSNSGSQSATALPDQARITPIVVDLHSGSDEGCLNLPVRAGDTIIVPPAGNVMVGGWVERPGEVQITPGMTVLGAITAAGGALYSSNVEVLRVNARDQRTGIPIDLAAVKSGSEPDVPVEAGDVVIVKGSVLGSLPYAFHELFTGLGAGIPIPIP